MAFKMNKPVWHGTEGHKKALKLNRSMDDSSLEDGRPKSSAFQKNVGKLKDRKYNKKTGTYGKKEDKRSETEKELQKKLDNRSSTYDYKKPSKETVKTYRETTKDGKDVNRTVAVTADKTTRQTIHKDKQESHGKETKWIKSSLKGAKKYRKKQARKAKKEARRAELKAEIAQAKKEGRLDPRL